VGTQIRRQLKLTPFALLALVSLLIAGSPAEAQVQPVDYFGKYGSKVPVIVQMAARTQAMEMLGIDPKLGKIFCNIPGVGQVNYELRRLKQQQVRGFSYNWPKEILRTFLLVTDEQFDRILAKDVADMREIMYPLLHYLEIPPNYFPIHEQSLAFVNLLIGKEHYLEALTLLGTINLSALEKNGYRDFSDLALDLVAKVISSNPNHVDSALKLLAKVNVRASNGNDHQAMLDLADSLRKLRQYSHAIKVYGRLGTIVAPLPSSPLKERVRLWPIYCYFKVSEAYSKRPDAASKKAASQYLNAARTYLAAIDKKPPARVTNEFSLYKLQRALLYLRYARMQEQTGGKSAESYYNQSVIEITEGIVSSRVGLDWLPEALLMAAYGYEKLDAKKSAENIYRQMQVFYKGTQWEKIATARLGAAP